MKKLRFTLCALVLGILPAHSAARPNILFIFSDDHAWQAVSAYNKGLIETPNIDRIGEEGIRFDRCLVANPLCGPSRATVLTGTHSHINGFWSNTRCTFDGSQPTFPKMLHQSGYETAIIGKWHLGSEPTGFDTWEILPGQGDYYNPTMILNGQETRLEGYVTDIITDRSLAWLKQRDPSKPFLLMCHQKAPHRNWQPNTSKLNFDKGKEYPEPSNLFDDYANRGPGAAEQNMTIEETMHRNDVKLTTPARLNQKQRAAWDAYYQPRNEAFAKANLSGKDLVRWKYQRYMHDYLACVSSVDDGVGRLLDYLKEAGLEENTIVIYASDQGFFLGEHGWFDKRWIYEESARTPFLMRWPAKIKPGTVSKALVSNLDFAQTILSAASLPHVSRMQGRSLLPLFDGSTPEHWRKSFYFHYYDQPSLHKVPRHYGIITDRYKLFHSYKPKDYWEMYDLKKDPKEMNSVYNDPEYAPVRKELEQELAKRRKELQVPNKDPRPNKVKKKK
ncbi:sulfatase [Verrucomicrobiaceae bacterium R5-34]|nr:sulfatase [Verrucomicrobiaceae bacterium R5-34]